MKKTSISLFQLIFLAREYILKDRNYCFLIGLRSEFETVRSLFFNWENPLYFDDYVVQVIKEENRLMSMHTSLVIESQVYLLKTNTAPTHGQSSNIKSTPIFNAK